MAKGHSGSILLGHDVHTGEPVSVSLDTLRSTGTHILGASGMGKSYSIRRITDGLIAARQPFAEIEPHGDAAEYTLWRLRRAGVRPEHVVIIDPRCPDIVTGFNPLSATLGDPSEITGFMLDAFQKCWGASSFDTTPRLEGLLRATIRTLVDSQLSLVDSWQLLAADNTALRRCLRERVTDELVRSDWEDFDKLSRTDRVQISESVRNRLRRVIQALPVQMMLAQTGRTLDLHEVMEHGKYLIINLSGVPPETQRLIGALMMNAILHTAKQRNPRKRRDYFVIADEFGEFATKDFANATDTLRKFGVYIIAAHQRTAQLDDDVLSAVTTNMKIKMVFGGLSRRDAEYAAAELYTGAIRGDRVKHVLRQTKFRPIEDFAEVETTSESTSDSYGQNFSESRGSSSGWSEGLTDTWEERPEDLYYDPDEHPFTRSGSYGRQDGESESYGEGRSSNWSRTRSTSTSLVPVTVHEPFSEVSSIAYHSLPEEYERHVALVHGLEKRHALIRIFNGPVRHIKTADVAPEVLDDRWYRYHRLILERSPYALPAGEVRKQLEDRRTRLSQMAAAAEEEGRPFDVRSFRQ